MKTNVYKFELDNGKCRYAVGVAISASKYGLVYIHDETGEKVEILPKKRIVKSYVTKFNSEEAAYRYYARKIGLLK
jgi:hypothetical protein